jgi:hypothetical protein
MSEGAVAAAVAVAAEHGLRADDPVVLSDAWHVLVPLRPLPLVARVSSGRPYPKGPSEEDVIRELAVASHAARAGAPVVPPSDLLPPGPHRSGGGDLVEILDGLEPSADVELLREIGMRPVGGRIQAVHGDAHLWNCLPGPLWHDFETACRGPREFDLAALALTDLERDHEPSRVAIGAHGAHDEELLEACVPVYAAWIYGSFMMALPRRPELGPRLAEHLRWLRERYA